MIQQDEIPHNWPEGTEKKIREGKGVLWLNPQVKSFDAIQQNLELSTQDIKNGEEGWKRYKSLLSSLFPRKGFEGDIDSPLSPLPHLQSLFLPLYGCKGKMYLKRDDSLPICGSVKARGGMYEVLHHVEELCVNHQLITPQDDCSIIASHPPIRDLLSSHSVAVGSTGNLGLSVGISGAALGLKAIVHMSQDAKEWKKELLRQKGATVIEHSGDYSAAVAAGRLEASSDANTHFVDDEASPTLFIGYSAAAHYLQKQLQDLNITVDQNNPLVVTIPCGVGGAPGGICFGIKALFGEHAHVFFVEPALCPSVLLGLGTGRHENISVQDYGLSGKTEADGLACSSPSGLSCRMIKNLVNGILTIEEKEMFELLRTLKKEEDIFIEPSSVTSLFSPHAFFNFLQEEEGTEEQKEYIKYLLENATFIFWATGGAFVPEEDREEMYKKYAD